MPTRRGKEPDKPKQEFRATCGQCDDGWLYEVWQITTWKQDGKKRKQQVAYQRPIPADWEAEDRMVRYYSATRRCRCVSSGVMDHKEALEPLLEMPAEIRQITIGSLVKRMP